MASSLRPEEFDLMPTLGDVPRHHARERGDRVALSFEGRETTFAALNDHSNRTTRALIAEGLKPGDRVCYFGKNSDHYFEFLFAVMKAGAVIAPIGWRLSADEVAYIIDDAQSSLLFVGPECIEVAETAAAKSQSRPKIIAMEAGSHAYPVFEAWRNVHPAADLNIAVAPQTTALLLYTSGTTGRPKGVMLTSANILRSRRSLAEAKMGWNEWQEGEVSYCAMPVAHIGGTGWGLVGLVNGVKNVIARDFNPMEALEAIPRERIAKTFMVPAALQFVIRTPRAREIDYSSLTHILYGASPMPVDLLRECMEVFGCGFVQQYGMTETTGTVTYLPPEDHDPKGNQRMRSAGLPMPGVEMAVLDADGKRLAANESGEIATRSAANMKGYWRKDDATAATIGGDGWLRTGDAGYIDEDGYVYIQDRIKDMIITGGENVYPAEVENAVHGHPHVAEVAVIGVPDATWGESVKAIVVPKPGVTPEADDIIAFARARIAHFKAPRSVDFLATPLPRSASGKILRRELREPYWAGTDRRIN